MYNIPTDTDQHRLLRRDVATFPALTYPQRTQTARTGGSSLPFFEFRNNFWLNLHHTLFSEAVSSGIGPKRRGVTPTAPLTQTTLTALERRDWNEAVAWYARTFDGRSLSSDGELIDINYTLSEHPDGALKKKTKLQPRIKHALTQAAPVYRKHWWKAHYLANRSWIRSKKEMIKKMDEVVVHRLEKLSSIGGLRHFGSR